jgi:hypothetical protein
LMMTAPHLSVRQFQWTKNQCSVKASKAGGLEFTSKADSAVNNTDAEEAWDNPDVRGPRRHNRVANNRTW